MYCFLVIFTPPFSLSYYSDVGPSRFFLWALFPLCLTFLVVFLFCLLSEKSPLYVQSLHRILFQQYLLFPRILSCFPIVLIPELCPPSACSWTAALFYVTWGVTVTSCRAFCTEAKGWNIQSWLKFQKGAPSSRGAFHFPHLLSSHSLSHGLRSDSLRE